MGRQKLDAAWTEAIAHQDLAYLAQLIAADFEGVCRYLFKIKDKKARYVPMIPNRSQRVLLRHIADDRAAGRPLRYWELKGRQIGSSTIWTMYLAWRALYHGENGLLVSDKEKNGKAIFEKLDEAYKRLPETLRPKAKQWVQTEILRLDTDLGGMVRRESAENIDIGVGETFQNALLTEGPLWRDAAASMHGFLPTVADNNPNSCIVWEFTARGVGDYTYGMWEDSVRDATGFTAIFFPWYWHTEEYVDDTIPADWRPTRESLEYAEWIKQAGYAYPLDDEGDWLPDRGGQGYVLTREQLAWREKQIRKNRGDVDKFRREYPGIPTEAFQTSGRLVIPAGTVDKHAARVRKPVLRGEFVADAAGRVKLMERDDGRMWVAEKPLPGHVYVVGADTSSGMGLDRSAVHVIDANDPKRLRVVAEFNGMEPPAELAKLLARLANAYNGALIAPERNHHGAHVIDVLRNHPAFEKRFQIYRHRDAIKRRATISEQYGFPTSRGTKGPLIDKLVELLFEDRVVVPFDRTVSEFRSFVYLDDGDEKVGASSGTHDDLVMSLAIGLWVADKVARQGSVEWDSGESSIFEDDPLMQRENGRRRHVREY